MLKQKFIRLFYLFKLKKNFIKLTPYQSKTYGPKKFKKKTFVGTSVQTKFDSAFLFL